MAGEMIDWVDRLVTSTGFEVGRIERRTELGQIKTYKGVCPHCWTAVDMQAVFGKREPQHQQKYGEYGWMKLPHSHVCETETC